MGMPPITTTTYVKEFKKVIEAAARGRQVFTVQVGKILFYLYFNSKIKERERERERFNTIIFFLKLYKPEGTSLGFSVVGLRSKDKGELGIFLQEIQPNGIAGW